MNDEKLSPPLCQICGSTLELFPIDLSPIYRSLGIITFEKQESDYGIQCSKCGAQWVFDDEEEYYEVESTLKQLRLFGTKVYPTA